MCDQLKATYVVQKCHTALRDVCLKEKDAGQCLDCFNANMFICFLYEQFKINIGRRNCYYY